MATLETLLIKVGVDASGVDRQTKGISQKLSGIGRVATATVTPALIGLGAVATNAASDLGESINAIETVFGSAAKQIKAFGETSEETVGLSTRAFNELVTPVGAALQNVGFSSDEAADASINLAERAADMASVFNTDVSEALGAIQAGLRGEADPLERFGVGLSAAAVEAKAMELGLADATGELDEQGKAQARVALLMEQTDKIAGDFADTAGSVANQERIAAAEAENMAASFGQQLLPVKQQLLGILRGVLGAFNGLSPSMQRTILTVAAVVAALGPVLLVGGQMISVVGRLATAFVAVGKVFLVLSRILLTNPWLLVAAAIIALVVIVVKNWDTIVAAISAAWNFIKNVTTTVWNAIVGFLKRNWKIILAVITGPIGALVILIASNWDRIRSITSRAWNAVVSFVTGAVGRLRSGVVSRFNSLMSFVRGIPGRLRSFFTGLPGFFRNIGRRIIGNLIDGIASRIGRIRDIMSDAASAVTRFWPFSPAKEGPLRSFPPELAGENIGTSLAAGLRDAERDVVLAAEAIAASAAITGPDAFMSGARIAAPASGGPTRVTFDFTGIDSEMAKAIRKTVRVEGGGDVQETFGVN